jgi:hypothetical protein
LKLAILGMLWGIAMPLWAQYAGPAILSRGEAPASMSSAQIEFRPFIEIRGDYDTGLAGVAVNEHGDLANSSAFGYGAVFGLSGLHSWKHTIIGADYRGSVTNYAKTTFFDSINQTFLFYAQHQFSPRIVASVRESMGSYSRDFGTGGLQQNIGFDPSTTFVPVTDFFDNRTSYTITQATIVIQKSRRLSFGLGADTSIARRRSAALYGSTVEGVYGDLQYRLTRRMTLGAEYNYYHFGFGVGTTDAHSGAFSYSVALTRRTEFTGLFGATRAETKFVQSSAVDPAIAALLGITSRSQIVHSISYIPNLGARLSRSSRHGVVYLSAMHRVNPGNGLFLTTYASNVTAGYQYTGLRHWTAGVNGFYERGKSVANINGIYTTANASTTLARQLVGSLHGILSYSLRRYDSPDFVNYRRTVNQVTIGLGFTPGDVPLRIW